MQLLLGAAFGAYVVAASTQRVAVEADSSAQPWMDLTLTPTQRAAALVKEMNLTEKVTLMHGTGWGAGVYVGMTDPIKRVGIPALHLNDGPQGFRCNGLGVCPSGTSTQFPSGLTIAATWSPNASFSWGDAMGQEFYNKGAHIQLGPGMCIARVPNNGRNFEYQSGEDPFLGYQLVQGTIRGIQGQGVVANAKHYILNNQETDRNSVNVIVDDRTLHEIYLPPFAGAVDAGVGSFMCSYNRVGGDFSCEHNGTLNTALRSELGFEGFVMSDWRAAHSTTAVLKGLDQEMPDSTYLGASLVEAVDAGTIPEAAVDLSATRILTPLFQVGVFDAHNNNSIDTNVSSPQSMRVAQELAEQSMVLLQNKGNFLPLNSASVKKIVVVGSDALSPTTGGEGSGRVDPSYLPPPLASIAGRFKASNCSAGHFEVGVDFFNGDAMGNSPANSAADCCSQCAAIAGCNYFALKHSTNTCYFKATNSGRRSDADVTSGGCHTANVIYTADVDTAVTEAADADAVVIFVSTTSSEGSDRATLAYDGGAVDTLTKVAAANPSRTVVAAVSPGAVLMPWKDDVASILLAFMPGQMYGDALANILFGDVAPSGRLPITLPNSDNEVNFSKAQYPGESGNVNYSEGLEVGYRWYDAHGVIPNFPFGHGLTYSTFHYSSLAVLKSPNSNHHLVTFDVTNNGSAVGHEVVQLYVGFPTVAGEPPKNLAGFSKLMGMKPGETRTATLSLGQRAWSIWNSTQQSFVEFGGEYLIMVGASSQDIRLVGNLSVGLQE